MMLGPRRHQRDQDGVEVDLSPLIDVTFLLLIFFVLTTSFSADLGVDIERPAANSANAITDEPLRVALDSGGTVYLEGRSVAAWMVQRRVELALARSGRSRVLLIADRRVEGGRMVEVIDQCRLAGAESVAIASRGGAP
ncbi:MAG: biopolymer transporter ExbD [Myxococcota bacterium]